MCLMDPASTLMVSITILKYPFNKGSSDVTINNNLIGEEEIFFTAYCAPIICALYCLVIVWHLCAGYCIALHSNH
jgi:hypothetical protein